MDPVYVVVGLRPYWSTNGSGVCCCRFEALLEREWIQCMLL